MKIPERWGEWIIIGLLIVLGVEYTIGLYPHEGLRWGGMGFLYAAWVKYQYEKLHAKYERDAGW